MTEIMVGKEKEIEAYKNVLAVCSYFLGQLAKFSRMAEQMQEMDEAKVIYAAERVNLLIPLLIKRKKELGLSDGLEFLENNSFLGFKIVDGVFEGNCLTVEKVIAPWLSGFPKSANNYQYEVSNYLHFLSSPDSIDLYPRNCFKPKKKEKKCKFVFLNWWSSVQAARGHIS